MRIKLDTPEEIAKWREERKRFEQKIKYIFFEGVGEEFKFSHPTMYKFPKQNLLLLLGREGTNGTDRPCVKDALLTNPTLTYILGMDLPNGEGPKMRHRSHVGYSPLPTLSCIALQYLPHFYWVTTGPMRRTQMQLIGLM